jgi:ABC-2 type transport system permease protein
VPAVVDRLGGNDTPTVGVHAVGADLPIDPVLTRDALLNARAAPDPLGGGAGATRRFGVTSVPDLATGRRQADTGEFAAVLAIERGPDEDLRFRLYTNATGTSSTVLVMRQATQSLAVADRLQRLGVDPADQASLFAPVDYALEWPDPTRADEPRDDAGFDSSYFIGFGMTILIFMMILLYGNWVAMSVAEEKSSRVMEVILNAATPFQLLAGKVLGVGAVAAIQYLAILEAGLVAILVQGPVIDAILGGGAGGAVSLPEGLTPGLLLLFGLYGVLGFMLYAVLFAAAGSLVSRQEDVNQVVAPMTLVASVG